MTAAASAGGFATGFGIETGIVNAGGFLGQILGKGYDVNQTLILAGVGVQEPATNQDVASLLSSLKGRGVSGQASAKPVGKSVSKSIVDTALPVAKALIV
jgi:hypothetical protein